MPGNMFAAHRPKWEGGAVTDVDYLVLNDLYGRALAP